MATKLYPPVIEGNLPAFYKNYDKDGELLSAAIKVPFGFSRAVSVSEVDGMVCRLRTVSTNTLVFEKDIKAKAYDREIAGDAYFEIKKRLDLSEVREEAIRDNEDPDGAEAYAIAINEGLVKLNEGQYYKLLVAFVSKDGIVGYFSTVGIIKCITKPSVTLGNGFSETTTNTYRQEFVGEYHQDTSKGDSTEKEYSYLFILTDEYDLVIADSGVLLHDSTTDTTSDSSNDFFKVHKEIPDGTISYIQYIVTTINGLTIASKKYQVMKAMSIDILNPIDLYAENNYDNGYIEITLDGAKNDLGIENLVSGVFVISRTDHKSNYLDWQEIRRFTIPSDYPSNYSFKDMTVEQGVKYKYAIQLYNNYKIYSNKVFAINKNIYDPEDEQVVYADFEDMFLYDGNRLLRIRFNPKVTSFKNTIPEQKVETIGSKYPFIFRNGHVNYKEFPIGGLLACLIDETLLFINNPAELAEGLMLEPVLKRGSTNVYQHRESRITAFERLNDILYIIYNDINYNMIPAQTSYNKKLLYYTKNEDGSYITYTYTSEQLWQDDIADSKIYIYNLTDYDTKEEVLRITTDFSSENIMSERYFKLKVLDWLTDGNVKLFRSPTEGNYLVRLLNVSMTPEEKLGRMIHSFTGTAYEIAEVTYDNLVYYHIIDDSTPFVMMTQWKTLLPELDFSNTDYLTIVKLTDETWMKVYFEDFAPGDVIRLTYSDSVNVDEIMIGSTGNYELNIEGHILSLIDVKINRPANEFLDFARLIHHTYKGLNRTKFDTIANIQTNTRVAEAFVGPKDNLMAPCDLITSSKAEIERVIKNRETINFTLGEDRKLYNLNLEILHLRKRIVIPIYRYKETGPDGSLLYSVTSFGKGFIKNKVLYDLTDEDKEIYKSLDETIETLKFLNDGYAILKVLVSDENGGWKEPLDEPIYFDTYTHSWWPARTKLNYTFSVSESRDTAFSNEISLEKTDEMYFRNLGEISKLTLGNAVMAELTFRMLIIDYDVEEIESFEANKNKKIYLAAKDLYLVELESYLKNLTKKLLYDKEVEDSETGLNKLKNDLKAQLTKIKELLLNILSDNFYQSLLFKLNNILRIYQNKKESLTKQQLSFPESYDNNIEENIPEKREKPFAKLKSSWEKTENKASPIYECIFSRPSDNGDIIITRKITDEITNNNYQGNYNSSEQNLFRALYDEDTLYKNGEETVDEEPLDSERAEGINYIIDNYLEKYITWATGKLTEIDDIVSLIPDENKTYGGLRGYLRDQIEDIGKKAFYFLRPWDALTGLVLDNETGMLVESNNYKSDLITAIDNISDSNAFDKVFVWNINDENSGIALRISLITETRFSADDWDRPESEIDESNKLENLLNNLLTLLKVSNNSGQEDLWLNYNGNIIDKENDIIISENNVIISKDGAKENISKKNIIEEIYNVLALKDEVKIAKSELAKYEEIPEDKEMSVIEEYNKKVADRDSAVDKLDYYTAYRDACNTALLDETATLSDEEKYSLEALRDELNNEIKDLMDEINDLNEDLLSEIYQKAGEALTNYNTIKGTFDTNISALNRLIVGFGDEISKYKEILSNIRNYHQLYLNSLELNNNDEAELNSATLTSEYANFIDDCEKLIALAESTKLSETVETAIGESVEDFKTSKELTADELCSIYQAVFNIVLSIPVHKAEYESLIADLEAQIANLELRISTYNNFDSTIVDKFTSEYEQGLRNNIQDALVNYFYALGIDFNSAIKERYG